MTKTYIGKSLYQKRVMLFWWFILIVAMTSFTMIFYPSLKNSNLGQALNALPTAVQKFTGGFLSFNTLSGYIVSEIFSLRSPLLLIILGIFLFNSISAVEERKGILETQITLPLTRSKIVVSKLFVGILIMIIASFGVFLGVLLGLLIIHDHYSITRIAQLTFQCFLLSLDFGLFTFLLACKFGPRGIVVGLSSTVAFLSYLINSMATPTNWLSKVDRLSLFNYYQNLTVYSSRDVKVLAIVGVVLIVLSYFSFIRRDVKT